MTNPNPSEPHVLIRALKWVLGEVWEKINLPAIWRELRALGAQYGRRFFWAALIWEIIEDGVFPLLSWLMGVPELIPLFLIFHFEPIAYPAIFWLFRTWDRRKGIIPEHPERSAHSASWRSWAKVGIYMTVVSGWLAALLVVLNLSWTLLIFYGVLMGLFGYIHERIWHDSNYGIDADDQVDFRRNLAKTSTYRLVALTVMLTAFRTMDGPIPWGWLLAFQASATGLYLALETVWSKSGWGIEATTGFEPEASD